MLSTHCPRPVSCCPAQLTEFGIEDELMASHVGDMVNKAAKQTPDAAYRETVSAAIIDEKDRLSDPRRAAREWERFLERAVRLAVRLDARVPYAA